MTVNVARRTRRRVVPSGGSATDGTDLPAIGEIDQTVFDCPSCSRPLAMGARRCPGCRTRLITGIPLAKAATFASVGLALGLLAGSGGGYLLGRGQAPAPGADTGLVAAGGWATASTAAGTPGSASATLPPPPAASAVPATGTDSAVPSMTRSAADQALATNARLAAAGDSLRAVLSARIFDTSEVARILRSISAESVFGEQLAARLAGWPGSAEVGGALSSFYGTVHETASQGLLASVRNAAAYRSAARAMLAALDGLPAADAALRAIASDEAAALP